MWDQRYAEVTAVDQSAVGQEKARPALMMTLDELKTELEGLELVIGGEVERHISEGRYHQGESAVVQVVARKQAS